MNTYHYQTKKDRSYFEWGDSMQIIRKGKGENSHDRERACRFLRCNMEETQLSIATASENIYPTFR